MESKVCCKCTIEKSIEEFYIRNKVTGTRKAWCKQCYAERHKEYYKNNTSYYKNKRARFKQDLKDMVNNLKAKPCSDCNNTFPPYVMDFDHIEDNKVNDISRILSTLNKTNLIKELKKVELVCSNCHRIRTHNRQQGVV